MPTFKNIRVPVGKSGRTRLQRVMVLKSGKFKFVKNIKRGSSSASRKKTSSRRKNTRKTANRSVSRTVKTKMLRTMSLEGGVEDIAWGFIGFTILGKSPAALPMTRTVQGLAAHALDRRGKARLVPGILDLISIWLAGGFGANGPRVSTSLRQLQKLSFL